MEIYNKHYIRIDDQSYIIDWWSDGPRHNEDITDAICINDIGDYQFVFDGESNPYPVSVNGIPLYKWNKSQKEIVKRSDAEIQADIDALPKPELMRSITYSDYLNLCMAVAMLYESQLEAKK